MFRGRRKTFLSLLSVGVILLLFVTVSLRAQGKTQKKPSRSSDKLPKHGDAVHAAATVYKYRMFDNYKDDEEDNSVSKEGVENRQITEPLDIRLFRSTADQLLYLYDKVLAAPWSINRKNLALFRRLFFQQTKNLTTQDELILTHQNVKLGDRIPYAFTNTMSKEGLKFYFNITQKILDEIPEVSPLSGKTFRRCSVVGNSGILRNSKCGKDIDKADYVFRSNIPPIRPFAADAGWKSNLSTMNPSVVNKRYHHLRKLEDHVKFAKSIGEYNGMLWLPCAGSVKMVNVCLIAKHSLDAHGQGNPRTVVSNPYHYIAVQYFWNQRNMSQFLSTGFYVTHLSLAMCDETHLYGFWPFSTRVEASSSSTANNTVSFRQRKVRYHYFDNLPGPNVAHSMQDEFGVLVQMHKLGILKMHLHNCED